MVTAARSEQGAVTGVLPATAAPAADVAATGVPTGVPLATTDAVGARGMPLATAAAVGLMSPADDKPDAPDDTGDTKLELPLPRKLLLCCCC
jgi:hypothetical protein